MILGVLEQRTVAPQWVESWVSVAIAAIMVSLWLLSLGIICVLPWSDLSFLSKGLILLWQTFLYTGLFVTAHDAMHGAVFPLNRAVNDGIGTAVLWLYGLFSYRELSHRHRLHHHAPASSQDPDYSANPAHYANPTPGFWVWYGHFMVRYWRWSRFFALVLVFNGVHFILDVPEANLAWGWVYPSVLSSLHLFYFGTYLPHRQPSGGYLDAHRSTTIARPFLWSLLACYHFGYHHEHHEYPTVPWWRLPQVYQQQQQTLHRIPTSPFAGVQNL